MKAAIIVVMTILLVLAQTTLCPLITILGVHPELIMGAVASIGLLYGRIVGGAAGLLCGLWIDTLFPATFGVYTLFYIMCGLLSGSWVTTTGEHRWWSAHLDTFLNSKSLSGRWRSDRIARPFISSALPAAAMKLIFAAIVYIMGLPMNTLLVPVLCLVSGGMAGVLGTVFYQLYALAGPRVRRGVFSR